MNRQKNLPKSLQKKMLQYVVLCRRNCFTVQFQKNKFLQ